MTSWFKGLFKKQTLRERALSNLLKWNEIIQKGEMKIDQAKNKSSKKIWEDRVEYWKKRRDQVRETLQDINKNEEEMEKQR